jgi:membrane protease YdiL (CAAX protease family)
MELVINIVMAGLIIYIVLSIKNNKISAVEFIKAVPNKYIARDIIVGIFIGFIAMIGIYLVELNLGYIEIQGINHINSSLIILFLNIAFGAFGEEILFRGFILNGLVQISKNKYLAVIITAVLFGLAHAANPSATTISIISNGLGGVMYSIAFLESSSIWLPLGLHFAWNFFQGPILGFPVSGLNFGGIVQQSFVIGNDIFNGAAYGPEGGVIGISFRILVIIMLVTYYFFDIKKRKENQYKSYHEA